MRKYISKITGPSGSSVPRDVIVLAVMVLALTLPFINQAFHWDDRDFVEVAQVKAQDFTKFTLSDYSYKGKHMANFRDPHPPVLSSYLGLLLRTGAEVSEPLFHTAYLIFPLTAAISMYFIARRFTRHPLVAAALFVASPGFLVMSHNIMDNLPGASLVLLAVALFIPGVDRGNWKLLLGSGFAMALGLMIAYQALVAIPLLVFYALMQRNFRPRTYLTFIIPIVVYTAWRYYFSFRSGRVPAISYQVTLHTDWQIRSIIVYIGGAIIFPLSAFVVFLRKKMDVLAAFLALPPLITWSAIYYLGTGEMDVMQALQMAVMISAGFLIVYRMAWAAISAWLGRAQKRGGWADPVFLLGWLAGVVVVELAFNIPFVAVRHLLYLFPPVILLFVREAEELWPMKPRLRGAFVYGTLALTLVYGLSAAVADYRMAGLYRDTAAQMKDRFAGSPTKVWALGEFDFRYYMEQNGFEYLGVDAVANPGDIVISSYVCSTGVVAPLPEGYYRVLSHEEPSDAFPVRTMNPWGEAGFYGNLMGQLPVSLSTSKMDDIDINELDWDIGGGAQNPASPGAPGNG